MSGAGDNFHAGCFSRGRRDAKHRIGCSMKPEEEILRVRLIHWKAEEAEGRAALLQGVGYDVEYEPLSQSTLRLLQVNPPDAIVIDLSRLPSQGRDIAVRLRTQKTTRHVPLVFVGGKPEKVARVQEILPDAVYTDWDQVGDGLLEAIQRAPTDPIVPESLFAGYAGTPLPKKLGIKTNATVALINAPLGFEQTLGELPQGATLLRQVCEQPDVTLWFITSRTQLQNDIEKAGKYAESGGLWIIWPKRTSGVSSDVTQNIVRRTGLESGLVDFKVAAIDETWSGLRFTRRRG